MCTKRGGTQPKVKLVPRFIFVPSALIVLVLFSAGLLLPAQEATAAGLCGKRTKLLNFLHRSYGELPKFRALTRDGNLVEVLISKHQSWTVIVTKPNGVSCLVSAGRYWERSADKPEGPGI